MHDIFQRQYVSFLKTHQFAIPTLATNKGNTNVLHRIQAKFKKLHAPKRVPTATLIVNYDHKKPIKRQLYRSKTAKKIVTGSLDKCELFNFLSPKMSLKEPLDTGNYFNSKSDRSISKNMNADVNKADTSNKKESFNTSRSMKELDNSNQQEGSKHNLYASCSPRQHISPALKKEIKQKSNLLSRHLHLYTSCPKSLRTEILSNDNADKINLTENIRIQGIKKLSPTMLKKQHIKCNSININKNKKITQTNESDLLYPPAIVITNEKNKATQSIPTKHTLTNNRNPNSKKLNGFFIQRQIKKIDRLKNDKKAVKLESAGVKAISKIDIRRKCRQVN